MKRGGPIARRKRLKPKRATQRRSSRVRDREHLLWVKSLPCMVGMDIGRICEGWSEADHAGKRGMGQKCSDYETIPLCVTHHRERTDGTGHFKGWNKARMRSWLDRQIALVQGHGRFLKAEAA